MALKGMVHALRRARQHLTPGGRVVLIQPHQFHRPHIAIVSTQKREPVAELINPVFQPQIDGANAAIDKVVQERLFDRVSTSHHHFKVGVANPSQLREYLRTGLRPPRFPPGGRQRFQTLWKARPSGADIEVTEFLTVIALRAIK
jgi:hypothetical protein